MSVCVQVDGAGGSRRREHLVQAVMEIPARNPSEIADKGRD